MCQWVAVAFAGHAGSNCTWDAIRPLKPGDRRSDEHLDIGPHRQTFALANVHAPFLSEAPYEKSLCQELVQTFSWVHFPVWWFSERWPAWVGDGLPKL